MLLQYYEKDLSRLGRPVPAQPSPETSFIPAVHNTGDHSDAECEDDDWKPKVHRFMSINNDFILLIFIHC